LVTGEQRKQLTTTWTAFLRRTNVKPDAKISSSLREAAVSSIRVVESWLGTGRNRSFSRC